LKPAVADNNFDANKNSRTPTPSSNRSSSGDPTIITTALHLPSSDEADLVPPRYESIQSMNTMNTTINKYNEYNNQYIFSINRLIQQSNVDKIQNKSSIASKTTQIAQQFLVCSHKTQNTSERG
jgi:hypothetical protein